MAELCIILIIRTFDMSTTEAFDFIIWGNELGLLVGEFHHKIIGVYLIFFIKYFTYSRSTFLKILENLYEQFSWN